MNKSREVRNSKAVKKTSSKYKKKEDENIQHWVQCEACYKWRRYTESAVCYKEKMQKKF